MFIDFLPFFVSSLCWKLVFDLLNAHRKSSVKAGCDCSLHSPGTQRETVHLHKQPSGTTGEEVPSIPIFYKIKKEMSSLELYFHYICYLLWCTQLSLTWWFGLKQFSCPEIHQRPTSPQFSICSFSFSLCLFPLDASEGAAGSRARNNWRPWTDGLERHRQWTHQLWLGTVHCHAWGSSADMTNFTAFKLIDTEQSTKCVFALQMPRLGKVYRASKSKAETGIQIFPHFNKGLCISLIQMFLSHTPWLLLPDSRSFAIGSSGPWHNTSRMLHMFLKQITFIKSLVKTGLSLISGFLFLQCL